MKTIQLIVVFLLFCGWLPAQDWKPIGHNPLNQPSVGYGTPPSFAMDGEDNLYLGFWDQYSRTPTVKKYDGNTWQDLNPEGFSIEYAEPILAITPDGIIYAALNTEIQKFDGNSWKTIGSTFDQGNIHDIALGPDETPYIAYCDRETQKPSVYKLVDKNWELIGNAGFTKTGIRDISLKIDNEGTPYVVCLINFEGSQTIIMKLNDLTWKTVGDTEILNGVGNPMLAIDSDNTLYLAFTDSLNGYKASVMKFDGSVWQPFGQRGFSPGKAVPDITFTREGIPYVAFINDIPGSQLSVMKFNGTNWEKAGNSCYIGAFAHKVSILIDSSDTPYVAFVEVDRDFFLHNSYKVRVLKIEGDTWKSVCSHGIFNEGGSALSFVVAPDGTPYMAYAPDNNVDEKTKVIKWINGKWELVGNMDYFKGIKQPKLRVAPDGTLFMVYKDSFIGDSCTLMKVVNDKWEPVGSAGFIAGYSNFKIDSDGIPYFLAGKDIMRFKGNNWEKVCEASFLPPYTGGYFAIDKQGMLYIAYSDRYNENRIMVKKFDGTEWIDIGDEIGSSDYFYPAFLSIDAHNNLYLALKSFMHNSTTVDIMRFDGESWKHTSMFSEEGMITDITMDPGGNFYLAYIDFNKGTNYENASVIGMGNLIYGTVGNPSIIEDRYPLLSTDRMGNIYMVYNHNGIYAYKYDVGCLNPTGGGIISGSQSGCVAFDPDLITSTESPAGFTGLLDYIWQSSIQGSDHGFTNIYHNAPTYDPGVITQTTWFRRLAKVSCMSDWTGAAISNVVEMRVNKLPGMACPNNDSIPNDYNSLFARKSYSALPESVPDSLAVYLINGQPIAFPYDFPIGTTTVEVKVKNSCAENSCSFTVTVSRVTGIYELANKVPSINIYPNPFTQHMSIEIANPAHTMVSIEVYDMTGRKIKSLLRAQNNANITCKWDGTDERGEMVPNGLYIVKMNEVVKQVVKGK